METRNRPILLLLMNYAAIFFLIALWGGPAMADQAADGTPGHEVIRKQKENYRIFFGLDDQRFEASEQSSRKLDMRDSLVSTVVNYPGLDASDPTGGGGPVLKTTDALFATHELGQLLRTKNPPSELAENNKYARTQAYERVLRDRILNSGGSLTPADVMKMALDATGGNYSLAALTAHNLLKNVAYVGRGEAELSKGGRLHLEDANRHVVEVASKLVNLRGNPAAGDKMGPWYHIYGILFLGSVTSGRTVEGMVTGEHFTRFLNVGSGEDREKQDWDWSIIFGMREIHAAIYKGENQDAPGTKQKQEQDEAGQKARLDKAVQELTQEMMALDGLRKRIKDASAEASAARARINDVMYNGIHRAQLDMDAGATAAPADCDEEVSKIMAEIANLAAYVQGQADNLDKDYDFAQSVVRQCASNKAVEEILPRLKARARSAKQNAAKSNLEIGKKKERLADILYRARQARESRGVNKRGMDEIIALAQKGLEVTESVRAAAEKAGNVAGELEKKKAGIRGRINDLRKDFALIAPYAETRLKLLEDALANEPSEADLKASQNNAAIAEEKKSIFVDTKVRYEGLKKLTEKSPPLPLCENVAIQDDSDRRAAAALVYIEMLDGQLERIQEDAAACLAELGKKASSKADWIKDLSGDLVGGGDDAGGSAQEAAEVAAQGETRKETASNAPSGAGRNELDNLLDDVASNKGVAADARRGKQEMERQHREKSQYIESGSSSGIQSHETFIGGGTDNLGEKIGKAFSDILEANRKNAQERRKIEEDWQRGREQLRDSAAQRQAERTREKPPSAQEGGAAGLEVAPSSEGRYVVILSLRRDPSHWSSKLPECNYLTPWTPKNMDSKIDQAEVEKELSELGKEGRKYEIMHFNTSREAWNFRNEATQRANAKSFECIEAEHRYNKTH